MLNSTDYLLVSFPAIRFYRGWFDYVSLKEVGTSYSYFLHNLFTISSIRFIAYSTDLELTVYTLDTKGTYQLRFMD